MKILVSFFLLGVTFASGPCLLSCGPLLVSYAVGAQKNIRQGITAYILFSLARISVYVALGALVFLLGKFITEVWVSCGARYIFIAGGLFICFLGLLTAWGRLSASPACRFLQSKFLERDTKSILTLGLMMGLLPCAPLLGLFSYSSLAAKSLLVSCLYALSFGLGTVVSPVLAALAMVGVLPRLLKNSVGLAKTLRIACGLIMAGLGLQLAWQGIR